MSLTSSPSRLYVAVIIIAGLILGYIVYSQWIKPASAVIPPPAISNQDTLTSFENLTIDFSVMDKTLSQGLNVYGESPVSPGTTGKKDLFAP